MKAFTLIFEQIKELQAKEKAIQQHNIATLKKAADEINAMFEATENLPEVNPYKSPEKVEEEMFLR